MNDGTPRGVMAEISQLHNPQRRRSPRLSSAQNSDDKMAQTAAAVKRSITVRKIAPRKTGAPPEQNKENTPRRPADVQQKKPRVPTPDRRASSPPPASARPPEPEDAVWSQKVRRSYSRLSDQPPDPRDALFGFEKLKTPEVVRRVEVSGSGSALNSFTSLLEADACGSSFPEPDPNIPGVVVVKERKRRRRKVEQIDTSELEVLAAKMNAEFEEAEEFELVVE